MAAPTRDVRKTVTVLFCDLVGSTALGSRLDAETLRQVQSRYFDAMRATLEAHGGTVEKYAGDAVMAVFGVPQVHEDDALRAARAAIEMQRRLATLSSELERDHGVTLEARIGLTSGEVVAANVDGGERLVTGDVVNTAKRLEEAARSGEVVVGDPTRRLLGDGVELESVVPVAAKGKTDLLVAWRLLRVPDDASPLPRRFDTPLVGRAHELAVLRHALDRAVERGTCELVTVLGAAGVGKSRLARELLEIAAPTTTSLSARCLPYGDGITFWPIAQIVHAAGGIDALRASLADVPDVELVLDRVAAAVGRGGSPAGPAETAWAVRRLLESLAHERPLVVCLEDIHWAESTLLDLIEYVVGWSRDVPIVVVCLARPDLLDIRPEWAAPGATSRIITLEPLSDPEAHTLLDLLGAADAISPAARERVIEAAEGNPLFVEQMTAMLLEEPQADVGIPPSLQVLLTARLDRLDEEERRVLEHASVAGKEFWRSAIAALAPEDVRARVTPTLMSLTRKGLVRPSADATRPEDDAFRFAHVLVRDAAYDSLPKAERADLHERFARWLRETASDRAGEIEEIEGYHLEQAYRYRRELRPPSPRDEELAERAGDLLGAAGRRAFARGDMPAALKLLDRAVALVTDAHPVRLDLMRELSMAFWSVGEVARAEALLNGVIEAAAASADRRVEWYALLERAGRRDQLDPTFTPEELFEVSERAIGVFEELGDDAGLSRAWRRMALVAMRRSHFATCEDAMERALLHARRAADAPEEARCVDGLCTALLYGPTSAQDAVARCEQMLADASSNPVLAANVDSALAGLRAMRGDVEAARHAASAEATYSDLGLRFAVVGLMQITGEAALRAGDPQSAERDLRRAEALLGHNGIDLVADLLGKALFVQGRDAEAGELAKLAEAVAGKDDVAAQVRWRTLRAAIEARRGRADAAVALSRAAVALCHDTDALNLYGDALSNLSDVLRLAGDSDAAAAALGEAIDAYRRKGNVVSAERLSELPDREHLFRPR